MQNQELIMSAGGEMVRLAKETGTWDALSDIEEGEIPDDLQKLFDQNVKVLENFRAFPLSGFRGIRMDF